MTTKTQALYEHAKTRIPGGTQLLSKKPERMAPGQWPAYHQKAKGCEIWDLDGKHYYDFSMHGIGACLLGFNDPDVTAAVKTCLDQGGMSTLNPPEEVELADRLCEIHPWADNVRFARTGGEAMMVAVRIARATTNRSKVAICGYHGWHDWYLAANLGDDDSLGGHLIPGLDPTGVPSELRGTALTFKANDRQAFEAIIDEHGDQLAAVVMEPCRGHDPEPGFLQFVREKTQSAGALLVFDEITIGWRLHFGGAHLRYGVNPDIAVFAKSLGNGHPMAAIIGTEAAMAGARVSFISSTYWTERIGPVAALAVLKKMSEIDVPAHVQSVGEQVQTIWRETGKTHSLPAIVQDSFPCISHFHFDHDKDDVLKTLFTQLMLDQGFLAGPAVYATLAHTEIEIDKYRQAVDAVFANLASILDQGDPDSHLKGPVAEKGFGRLTN